MSHVSILKATWFLLQKEFLLEWRQRFALSGILLYVCATVFVVFIATKEELETDSWNSFFWIVVLFASVNAVTKSFGQENSDRMLYYYTLFHPIAVILSKILYNVFLLFLLCLLTYGAFTLFISNPICRFDLFMLALFLGSSGFAIILTFISAIASKAVNSASLMAILSFPVLIPVLLTVIRLTSGSFLSKFEIVSTEGAAVLVGIDLVMLGMSLLLFPQLWRD